MTDRHKALEWFKFLRSYMKRSEYEGYLDLAISALEKQEGTPDPWDGVKPHAPDGFVKKYCEPYTEEEA